MLRLFADFDPSSLLGTAGSGYQSGRLLMLQGEAIGKTIFLGLFFAVVAVVLLTLTFAFVRARRDLGRKPLPVLRWELDFEDLPARARTCRHELTGEVAHRTCHNNFDCGRCDRHADFEAVRLRSGFGEARTEAALYGFDMPGDRLYHRGHTWARPEPDGTMTIGIDDIGRRLVGSVEIADLPAPGSELHHSGPAWSVRKNGVSARLLSPVDGEVLATGTKGDDWVLRVKPRGAGFDTRHLLRGAEIRPWVLREMERLQLVLAPAGTPASLADGGLPVESFPDSLPAADWDDVWGEMFLER